MGEQGEVCLTRVERAKGRGRGEGKASHLSMELLVVLWPRLANPALEAAIGATAALCARLQCGGPEAGQLVGQLHLPRVPNRQFSFLFSPHSGLETPQDLSPSYVRKVTTTPSSVTTDSVFWEEGDFKFSSFQPFLFSPHLGLETP